MNISVYNNEDINNCCFQSIINKYKLIQIIKSQSNNSSLTKKKF